MNFGILLPLKFDLIYTLAGEVFTQFAPRAQFVGMDETVELLFLQVRWSKLTSSRVQAPLS